MDPLDDFNVAALGCKNDGIDDFTIVAIIKFSMGAIKDPAAETMVAQILHNFQSTFLRSHSKSVIYPAPVRFSI